MNFLALVEVLFGLALMALLVVITLRIIKFCSRIMGQLSAVLAEMLFIPLYSVISPFRFVVNKAKRLFMKLSSWLESKNKAVISVKKALPSPWMGLTVMSVLIVAAIIHHLCIGDIEYFLSDVAFTVPLLSVFGWMIGESPFSFDAIICVLVCGLLLIILRGHQNDEEWSPKIAGLWDAISTAFSAVAAQYVTTGFGSQTLDELVGGDAFGLIYLCGPLFIYVVVLFFLYTLYDVAVSLYHIMVPVSIVTFFGLFALELGVPGYFMAISLFLVNIFACFRRAYDKKKPDINPKWKALDDLPDLMEEDEGDKDAFIKLMIASAISIGLVVILIGGIWLILL